MQQVSKQELYFKKKLDELGTSYQEQVKFIYFTFKHTPKRARKNKTYTADFVIKNKVIEIKGFYGREKWNERKGFIYDYLYEQGYELITINATYKDIDKWFEENKNTL